MGRPMFPSVLIIVAASFLSVLQKQMYINVWLLFWTGMFIPRLLFRKRSVAVRQVSPDIFQLKKLAIWPLYCVPVRCPLR